MVYIREQLLMIMLLKLSVFWLLIRLLKTVCLTFAIMLRMAILYNILLIRIVMILFFWRMNRRIHLL